MKKGNSRKLNLVGKFTYLLVGIFLLLSLVALNSVLYYFYYVPVYRPYYYVPYYVPKIVCGLQTISVIVGNATENPCVYIAENNIAEFIVKNPYYYDREETLTVKNIVEPAGIVLYVNDFPENISLTTSPDGSSISWKWKFKAGETVKFKLKVLKSSEIVATSAEIRLPPVYRVGIKVTNKGTQDITNLRAYIRWTPEDAVELLTAKHVDLSCLTEEKKVEEEKCEKEEDRCEKEVERAKAICIKNVDEEYKKCLKDKTKTTEFCDSERDKAISACEEAENKAKEACKVKEEECKEKAVAEYCKPLAPGESRHAQWNFKALKYATVTAQIWIDADNIIPYYVPVTFTVAPGGEAELVEKAQVQAPALSLFGIQIPINDGVNLIISLLVIYAVVITILEISRIMKKPRRK